MNIDSLAKGNLGLAVYGGVFQDSSGYFLGDFFSRVLDTILLSRGVISIHPFYFSHSFYF